LCNHCTTLPQFSAKLPAAAAKRHLKWPFNQAIPCPVWHVAAAVLVNFEVMQALKQSVRQLSGVVPWRGKLSRLNSRLLGTTREEMPRNSAITMGKQGATNKGSCVKLADIT
jgi:hypothetical protein